MTQLNNLKNMKKNNATAFSLLLLPISFLAGMLITLDKTLPIYLLGQIIGSIFFTQAFILLHEFGHRSMFKNKKYNTIFGYFFSFMVFIPFHNWREIHSLHHKWTGFRDKDPTTEKTFSDRLSSRQEKIINFCWHYSIPIFTLGYRFGIYWKSEKLKRHLSHKQYVKSLTSLILYGGVYLFLFFKFPTFFLLILPALYMSWIMCEILTLSQHSHIHMPISDGKEVTPLNYREQMQYSRSLIFPKWISTFILFNLNYHEAHHAYPGIPCYYLNKLELSSLNSFPFFPWLKKVKSMKAVDFIFNTGPKYSGF